MTEDREYKIATEPIGLGDEYIIDSDDAKTIADKMLQDLQHSRYLETGSAMNRQARQGITLDWRLTNTEGGDTMKVYEIIFVDEEEEEILHVDMRVAQDKDSALLKALTPKDTEDYGKLVRELGPVS